MKVSLLLLLAAMALGCEGIKGPLGQRRSVPPERGGTLQLADHDDIRSLDPATSFDVSSAGVMQLLFTPLLDYDREGHLIPLLAEHFELSADGRRVAIKLHEGALFHDGTEVTAEDVKRSIERALDHDTPCLVASFFASIAGYAPFHDGVKGVDGRATFAPHLEGVVIDGRYALHFDLSEVDSTFLPALSLHTLAPVCKNAGSKYGHEWGAKVCGSGPFRLEQWHVSREITVVRHEGYFEPGLPYLDRVRFYSLMSTPSQRFKFGDGELDHLRDFSTPDLLAYRRDPRWKPFGQWEPAKEVNGIFFNTRMKPFDNVELRRAVTAAIDWPNAISARPEMTPASQVLPPAVPGYDPAFRGQVHDIGAALEHMQKAGYPFDPRTRVGGYPEPVVFVGPSETAITETLAPIIQQELARIGIRMDIRQVSYGTSLAEYGQRDRVQLGYAGWSMDFPDPADFFEPPFSSASVEDDETQNYAHYSNPALDDLLRRARRELDPAARASMYRRCEEIVRDDAPWAIGFLQRRYELVQPYVHDYRVDAKHSVDVRYVWIDSTERRHATRRPRRLDPLALIRPWGRP